jgi:hypothetical protein
MNKNMNKRPSPLLLHALAVGAVALLAQNAQSQGIVYNNTTTYNGNFDFAAGTQVGNEVVLAGSGPRYALSTFQVQFNLNGTGTPNASDAVELLLYNNTGGVVQGANSPGAIPVYNSGFSSLTAFTAGSLLTYTLPANTVVNQDFTWVLEFQSVPAGETAGLALFGPTTVGFNYHDAWENSGSGWALDVAGAGNPALEFGAVITATAVPEPTTIVLGVMGACAFLARRRKN